MGILDEAIREHLDLKRRRGAGASELEQLEQEAFGPPTRPGEPDFPDRSEEGAEGPADAGFDAAAAETTFMPVEETIPPTPAGEVEVSEAEEPVMEPDMGEAEAAEGESAAPVFDQDAESEMELGDLELELDEEAGIEPEAPPADSPIESLETEEHRMDELLEEGPPAGEPAAEGDETEALVEEEPAEDEDAEESDVLEETPEFLRDQPEDDELWFEQGEPKDFDF
jgi:hypothetical protein